MCWEEATVNWGEGYDGDSFDVRIDGQAEQVRLIGVDAPEWYMHGGSEAKSALRTLIGDARICLEKDVKVSNRDEYDRLLRYVWVGGELINAELLRQGYAWVYTYEANAQHLAWFLELEREAKAARRGLWGAEPPTSDECPLGCTDHRPGCNIKGNISEDGQKIYHMPGQQYYDNTQIDPAKGERWFCSEEAALANGWRKSKR
jgi:micrococcal nuclease